MDLENIPFNEAEPIHNGMLYFRVIMQFEEEDGRKQAIWWKGSVFAYTIEDVEFVLDFTGVPHVDTPYFTGSVDASDVGGLLGEMLNKFDPRNN